MKSNGRSWLVIGATLLSLLTPSPALAATVWTPEQLEVLLLKEVPAGFVQVPNGQEQMGPLDLAGASSHFGLSQQMLEEGDFISGYLRTWFKEDTADAIGIALFQFGNVEQAAGFLRGYRASRQETGVTIFEASEVPNAFGYTSAINVEGGAVHGQTVMFRKANLIFDVSIVGTAPTHTPQEAIALGQAQHAALSAVPDEDPEPGTPGVDISYQIGRLVVAPLVIILLVLGGVKLFRRKLSSRGRDPLSTFQSDRTAPAPPVVAQTKAPVEEPFSGKKETDEPQPAPAPRITYPKGWQE